VSRPRQRIDAAIPSTVGGWVQFPRRLVNDALFADAELFRLYAYLKLTASYQATRWAARTGSGITFVELAANQAVVGRATTAAALNMNESSFRRRLSRLATLQYVSLKSARHFTIVTILELPGCESNDDATGQPTGHI
jgi:hypothetical protein